jgi:hypothetical protein
VSANPGQRQPWRGPEIGRQVGGRVSAETDERGLPERRLSCHAGQQHEAERDNAVKADVVAERYPEWRRDERQREQRRRERDRANPRAGDAQSSSSW